MKNYFIDTAQFKKFDKIRFVYLIVFILSFIFTELGRNFYRPYIYENGINDFGLADSIGNWGGILVQIFFGLVIVNPIKIKGIRLIIFFTIGYIIYEIMQPILPRGTFDWKDIYGTLIGGLLGLILFLSIHWMHKGK